jgi:hypothetical protein
VARHSERTRRGRPAVGRRLHRLAFLAGSGLALLAAPQVPAQQAAQPQPQRLSELRQKLGYLIEAALKSTDPSLRNQLQQMIQQDTNDIQAIEQWQDLAREWDTYRQCQRMKSSNDPFDGRDGTMKAIKQLQIDEKAQAQIAQGILGVIGGPPQSAAGNVMSATTGEANGAAQDAALEAAKDLTEGSWMSEALGKLSTVLSIFDGGTQLFHVWKMGSMANDVLDQRDADLTALTDCKKPPKPDPRRQLAQGTPYLRPFPPGAPPPPPPKNPPPQNAPKQPSPPRTITLRQFLQQAVATGAHGG